MSGLSPDGLLPEIVERPDHPWFVGVQFHPELKSKPFEPHPLFVGFVSAAGKSLVWSDRRADQSVLRSFLRREYTDDKGNGFRF